MTPTLSLVAVSRLAGLLLWALALWNTFAYRGLFWDGTGLLTHVLDQGWFHWHFYPARAHVMWLTQAPVVAAIELGVNDTSILSFLYSAALFGLPAAIYQIALIYGRRDAVALTVVLAAIAVVYVPTSFFIVSEFHVAAAIAVAAACILATSGHTERAGALLLVVLGLIAIRSYEAMIHLGPLLAVATTWRVLQERTRADVHALISIAAFMFVAASGVSADTVSTYWAHPHAGEARETVLRFVENSQFVVALAAVAPVALAFLFQPRLLRAWVVYVPGVVLVLLLAVEAIIGPAEPIIRIYAPSHYVARTGAGALLWGLLAGWLFYAFRSGTFPSARAVVAEAGVAARLPLFCLVLIAGGIVPDLVLTVRWSAYLDTAYSVVRAKVGRVELSDTPLAQDRYRDFVQDWSLPAFSLLLRKDSSSAVLVVPVKTYGTPWMLNPDIRLPPLEGYAWRR
jgi:hypothetical protein